jgi:hypothetical protein
MCAEIWYGLILIALFYGIRLVEELLPKGGGGPSPDIGAGGW